MLLQQQRRQSHEVAAATDSDSWRDRVKRSPIRTRPHIDQWEFSLRFRSTQRWGNSSLERNTISKPSHSGRLISFS